MASSCSIHRVVSANSRTTPALANVRPISGRPAFSTSHKAAPAYKHCRSAAFSPSLRAKGRRASSSTNCTAMATSDKLTVLVTGAAGRTGQLVLRKLLTQADKFETRGLVRSEESIKKLEGISLPEGAVAVADVVPGVTPALEKALAGADALVICTSAVPRMKAPPQEGSPPQFDYPAGQYPEQVDWEGQKTQIDAAKAAGVKKVVLVSSMGGTQKDNRLNAIGNGNILIFKRKAEEYLMASGLDYTIIHPGGLTDGKGGERELVIDVDDKLLEEKSRSIPREDVAEMCVQSLTLPQARNRSFDAITKDGPPTTNFATLLSDLKADCKY